VLGALLITISFVLSIGLYIVMVAIYAWRFSVVGLYAGAVLVVLLASWLVAGVLVPRHMFRIGVALRQPDAIELLKVDRRAPVLYLRSFDDDAVPDLTESLAPLGPRGARRSIEMRLSQVFKGLGPVISIGRPGERLPEIGANRFYVSDDDWQEAVLYFLERAVAVVILVGRSTGVTWEIKTALRTVPHQKVLFVFPYLLPKEKRPSGRSIKEAIRSTMGHRPVRKAMLADLMGEHDARYRSFREEFGDILSPNLPPSLHGGVFLDFVAAAQPRLIQNRQPLFIRRSRDRQGLTLDYRRTLRPFLEKLQGQTIEPDWVEWFFTNRFTLSAFTAGCVIVFIFCFFVLLRYMGFFFLRQTQYNHLQPVDLVILLSLIILARTSFTLAILGVRNLPWNLSLNVSCADVMKRLVAAGAGFWLGSVFAGMVYLAGKLPLTSEVVLEVMFAASIGGLGGVIAGLIAGLRRTVWRWVAAVTGIGVAVVFVGVWLITLLMLSGEHLDAGDILGFAFPLLLVGGAIWGVVRAQRA
jgi:hypothetical protein